MVKFELKVFIPDGQLEDVISSLPTGVQFGDLRSIPTSVKMLPAPYPTVREIPTGRSKEAQKVIMGVITVKPTDLVKVREALVESGFSPDSMRTNIARLVADGKIRNVSRNHYKKERS